MHELCVNQAWRAGAHLSVRQHAVDLALIAWPTYVTSLCRSNSRMISLTVHDFETPSSRPTLKVQGEVENPEASGPFRFFLYP